MTPWFLQVAQGLVYLHSRGIIHGDIAARNILIGPGSAERVANFMTSHGAAPTDLDLKLSDFGLAALLESEQSHMTIGGVEFDFRSCAPEYLEKGAIKMRREGDVWSFGVLMWEMMTLVGTPFAHIPDKGSLYRILLEGTRLPIDSIVITFDVSVKAQKTMKKCWEFRTRDRQTAQQIAESFH